MRRRILDFDHHVTERLQGRPWWLQPLMLAASFLGLPAIASILVAGWIFVVFGLTQLSILIALLLCFIACGLVMVLKLALHRPRPLTEYAKRMRFQTYSFPSGHSFSAAVLYGFAAHLISLYALTSWAAWTTLALYGLILLVGISRVYLGAHYILDVLAGWALGIVILWAIVTVVPV